MTLGDGTGRIVLQQVTQRFALPRESREFTALQDVSFDVAGGEFVSIVGPSGCGKSTLLGLIAGLVPTTAGRITVGGRPVANGGYLVVVDAGDQRYRARLFVARP